jgi:hypothetical protein
MKSAVDKHPCYTEAKTLSLNLRWSELRFCFGIAMVLLRSTNLATAPVIGALMDQRRVGRLTFHWSERDHHKVLTHGHVARRSVH